jgi:hypothetical protein
LNVYFNVGLPGAGQAVLIEIEKGMDQFVTIDGCIVLPSTVPGGAYTALDQGKTAVHEIGHWLGLYHTFQDGCADGDKVSDTPPAQPPPRSNPVTFCDKPYNTCPDKLGPGGTDAPDPNTNFMSYSIDSCMDVFTEGQK